MRTPSNDAGALTNNLGAGTFLSPFALSLSKGCPFFAEDGQCFEKLIADGIGLLRRFGGAA